MLSLDQVEATGDVESIVGSVGGVKSLRSSTRPTGLLRPDRIVTKLEPSVFARRIVPPNS